MANRPEGTLATRPLHIIWIVDCSESMAGDKINSLNFAIEEALPAIRKESDDNPSAQIFVSVLRFSNGAEWITNDPVPIEQFVWYDLQANGLADMGQAFSMVADVLTIPPMPERALPPVLVLISNCPPTDDYLPGLTKLMSIPWGKKAIRLAVAIGADADRDVLQKFIGNPEMKPFEATNAEALVKQMRWVSTVVPKATPQMASQIEHEPSELNTPVPPTYDDFIKFDSVPTEPRSLLIQLIETNTLDVINDRVRLGNLLNDYFQGKYKKEKNTLIAALDDGIPANLIKNHTSIPVPILVYQLGKNLVDNRGISGELAIWAVTTWALALGIAIEGSREILHK